MRGLFYPIIHTSNSNLIAKRIGMLMAVKLGNLVTYDIPAAFHKNASMVCFEKLGDYTVAV